MNAGTASARSPHLDLEDLIAEVTGQAAGGWAREHLAGCAHCQREAGRWNLVAEGVRGLAAAAPEVAQPARPDRARPGGPAGRRRRATLAAGAAAALLLLGGAGYWGANALASHASGTVLTAVSGCAGLELAHGTLARVNGASLVIRSADGQRVTVTTTASTTVSVAGALLGDIRDGAPVIVLGPDSGGTIAAVSVIVRPPAGAGGKGALRLTPPPGWAAARGTVSDAGSAGFTVVTSGGARIRVTTTGGTRVLVPHASMGQLRVGVTTVALGRTGASGKLSAIGILQQPPGPVQVQFNRAAERGCPPASIANALAAAFGASG